MAGGEDRGPSEGPGRAHDHDRDHQSRSLSLQELPSVDRLLALSDGVVAIAITLIVLQLDIPTVSHATSPSQLAQALGNMGNQLVVYVISFAVIAQFWLAHHRVFRLVRGHDEGLAWVNFFFLFTITVMPFTSKLLGTYGQNPVAVDVFALNLVLASLSATVVVIYGRWRHLLLPEVGDQELAVGRWRGGIIAGLISISAVVAWFSTSVAQYLWFGLFLTPWVVGWKVGRQPYASRRTGSPPSGVTPS